MDWRRYAPTLDEQGEYQGFLSTVGEYHAVGVGFLAAVVDPRLLVAVVAYGLGIGRKRAQLSGHARDAAKELGYTALGAALGIGVRALGAV